MYEGHLETLVSKGMLRGQYNNDAFFFDVTPEGINYYQWLKQQAQDRVQQMETTVTSYFSADRFQKVYLGAYQKWAEAERLLWGSDSAQQLTTIGHLCREAIQEYATTLVERYHPSEVDADKAHDIARVRAVLNLRKDRFGEREREFLEALLTYWVRVSKLVQRQEHGTQPGGEAFIWDDARRVVFHTAIVMVEIDQSLSRS